MTDRIEHWAKLLESDEPSKIIQGRRGLVGDFRRYSNDAAHRYEYTQLAGGRITPLLGQNSRLRQLNVALALAQMPEVSVHDSLIVMLSHGNPGVRYLACRGYLRLWTRVLSQGAAETRKMLDALEDRAAKDASPHILKAIFEVLAFRQLGGVTVPVPEAAMRAAKKRAYAILATNWKKCWSGVLASDTAMTEASRKAIAALLGLRSEVLNSPNGRGALAQMVVDMVSVSSKVYLAVGGKGQVGAANAELLLECEQGLNAVAGKQNRYVTEALTDPKVVARPEAVRLAVLRWIDELMKEAGLDIKEPDAEVPKPRTQPASQPPEAPTTP
jgi:hypothetical protein